MSVIDISPVPNRLYDRPTKITPVYLVLAENPANKNKLNKYVALKMDETSNAIKIVAAEVKEDVQEIIENYQAILSSVDKSFFAELMLPWHRIVLVQNLIYKHK